jgi:hypothetical protein
VKQETFDRLATCTRLITAMIFIGILIVITTQLSTIIKENAKFEARSIQQMKESNQRREKMIVLNALRTTLSWFTTEELMVVKNRAQYPFFDVSDYEPIFVKLLDGNDVIVGYFDKKGVFHSTLMFER